MAVQTVAAATTHFHPSDSPNNQDLTRAAQRRRST